MRTATEKRKTSETDIAVQLTLDGTGKADISTGIGFFDHMLELFAKHGLFDISISCSGDTWVDDHHTVEDTGLVLGKAFASALADKGGIARYGQRLLPMDEVLCLFGVDLSARSYVVMDAPFSRESLNGFSTECVQDFFRSFSSTCGANLGIKVIEGSNDHHIIEAMFKAFGRAMREACSRDERLRGEIPSTKGTL